ncbi:hypothetical protein N7541_006042 [Penicillium brevicompactum]|uniref:Thioredoxin-like protein n=1 Tax=Penicillium brevicompactum TaxID=5074 RepID=A0A9W9R4C1_PENBR|nr:hypothetical protein N7541_006042 [Penicillium brevicompactum]
MFRFVLKPSTQSPSSTRPRWRRRHAPSTSSSRPPQQPAKSQPKTRLATTPRHAKQQRGDFELEVTTSPPTLDQLRSILDYVSPVSGIGGPGEKVTYGVAELVKGARDAEDALKKFKENNENFVRPVTVDWTNGRAVIGDHESEILRMVRQLPAN